MSMVDVVKFNTHHIAISNFKHLHLVGVEKFYNVLPHLLYDRLGSADIRTFF